MRHPTKPICGVRIASDGDAFNLGYQQARYLRTNLNGDHMLVRKIKRGSGHEWHRIAVAGEVIIGKHAFYPGKCGGLRAKESGRSSKDHTYYIWRVGDGVKLGKARWIERVVARLNRCPEELAIALHSGLVESIEL